MQIELKISYEIDAHTPGKVIQRKRFVEPRLFEIEELSGADAPVATTWGDDNVGWRECTRWYEGHHYKRFDGPANGHPAMDVTATVAALQSGEKVRFEGLTAGFMDVYGYKGSLGFRPEKLLSFDAAKRDEWLAEADRWQAHCLLIDGEFHMRCPEPAYMITARGVLETVTKEFVANGIEHTSLLGLHPFQEGRPRMVFNNMYRADQLEKAIDRLRLEYRQARELLVYDKIEVLMPETLSFDPESAAIAAAALDFVQNYERRRLHEIHPDILHGIASLSGMSRALAAGTADVGDVATALDYVFDLAMRLEEFPMLFDPASKNGYITALERWNEQPMAIMDIAYDIRRP